jgi:hypothetical protein
VTQLARQLFGLPIPDEGALFDVALACHIAAGLTCVITGVLAATAPKRPGRHPLSGRTYFWSLAVVFASSTTMAVLRFAQDWHLLLIGTVAFGAGSLGYLVRRRRQPGWLRIHIPAMGGSYIAPVHRLLRRQWPPPAPVGPAPQPGLLAAAQPHRCPADRACHDQAAPAQRQPRAPRAAVQRRTARPARLTSRSAGG